MQSELSILKKELKSLNIQRDKLDAKINSLEFKTRLPKLQKKYIGKYFKMDNSYGDGKKWCVYAFVHRIIDIRHLLCDSFETDSKGRSEFVIHHQDCIFEGIYDNVQEITKVEYNQALDVLIKRINSLDSRPSVYR